MTADATTTQEVDEKAATSMGGARVTATIDGKDYVWDTPRPDTDSCGTYGDLYWADFISSENETMIKFNSRAIQVELEDGTTYTQALNLPKALNRPEKGTVKIDGDLFTYEGLMNHNPKLIKMGETIPEVEATITATCPPKA